jgi:hypothetical protein
MSSAATRLYIPVREQPKAKDLAVSKPERKAEEHFWRTGAEIRDKGERDWIVFLLFGAIALAAVVPAFVTLFHLVNTDALLHVVERVPR